MNQCKDVETARKLIAQLKGENPGRPNSNLERTPQTPRYDVPEAGERWLLDGPRRSNGEPFTVAIFRLRETPLDRLAATE